MNSKYSFHISLKSFNVKVGKIPVTTSSRNTCPTSCPMRLTGCYANAGPLAIHWNKVSEGDKRVISFESLIDTIAGLPEGQLWRHNQAGDLCGNNEEIDAVMLQKLVNANTNKKGFTYTHKTNYIENHQHIKNANKNGFTINLSANNPAHADELAALNIGPVVTTLHSAVTENTTTPQGRKIVICPAIKKDNVSCSTCQLCQKANRSVIVGFPSHGAQKKKVDAIQHQ